MAGRKVNLLNFLIICLFITKINNLVSPFICTTEFEFPGVLGINDDFSS